MRTKDDLVSVINRTEPKLKSGKQKNEKVKAGMLRSIGKQSRESVESVLKKAAVEGFAEKASFKPGVKE